MKNYPLFFLLLLFIIPTISNAAEMHTLEIDFSFSAPDNSAKQLLGYRLYKASEQVCETNDPSSSKITCEFLTGGGTYDFTLTAYCPRTNQGIIATYGGYFSVSDYDGQLRFPRLHQQPNFTLIITPQVKPVFMIGNTIHHWELIPGVPYSAYRIHRKEEPETKTFYWDVSQIATIENNIIPFKDAITLYAKPNNIFVPEGITFTSKSPNLVLPQIFARKNRSGLISALNFLKNRIFFGKITEVTKKANDLQFSSQIVD